MTVFNNLIFVPFISMVIFPLSFFVLFIPKLDFIYNILLNLLENLSLFIFKFKIEIILCKMNLPAIVLYYLIITFVLFKLFKKKYQYLILIIILLFIHKNINYIKNNPYITFLDVGQGDCALIHLPYNKGDILIDTGWIYSKDISGDIISYLKSEGISDIDYLILTHGDYDHIGNSLNIIENFKVNHIIINSGNNNNLEQKIIKSGVKYYILNKGILNISNYKLTKMMILLFFSQK